MSRGGNLYLQLLSTLKHFNLNELKEYVMNQIQDLNWDDVIRRINDRKRQFSRINAVNIIVELVNELELDENILQEFIQNCNLLAIGLSKSKTWQTYKLLEPMTNVPSTVFELCIKLEKRYRQANIRVEVHSIDHDGKFIIGINKITSPKKKTDKPRVFLPYYIIFHPSTNFIFTTKSLGTDNFVICLVKGLGFKNLKNIKLTGKNINELIKILLYKENSHDRIEYTDPKYIPKIKTSDTLIDFTRTKEKMEYANEIYEENFELQSLTFNMLNKPCVSKELQGKKFSASLMFISPNVTEMLKTYIAKDIINAPVPDYLIQALKCGKNTLNLGNVED